MQIPFRLASVPTGLVMTQLIESTEGAERRTSAAFELAGSQRPLIMEILNVTDPMVNEGAGERSEIGGRAVEIRAASQSICLPTESQPVSIFGPVDEPAADWSPEARAVADRTAELLRPVDDPADETGWLDADQALPR